jgi:hypothetical protein
MMDAPVLPGRIVMTPPLEAPGMSVCAPRQQGRSVNA